MQALVSSCVEKLVPATHEAHLWSSMDEPRCDTPEPAGHVDHAVQTLRPEEALNVPARHMAHLRSAVAVAADLMCEPAPQGLRTRVHGSALLLSEKLVPTWHAAHWRSAVADPCATSP